MTEQKTKGAFFREMVKPFLVLTVICLAVSALLGFTNYITKPVIERNEALQAEATRREVLPEADGFTELASEGYEGVRSIYRADNGAGYVITASAQGYKGEITVTVGFDNEGTVVGLNADVSTETVGIGTKAGSDAYLANYMGLTEGAGAAVDTITSATYSSRAVRQAIDYAMAACAGVRG